MYKFRNQIAHGAYVPSHAETNEALAAGTDCRPYVIQLVRASKGKYSSLMRFLEPR